MKSCVKANRNLNLRWWARLYTLVLGVLLVGEVPLGAEEIIISQPPLADQIQASSSELTRIRQEIAGHRQHLATLTAEERDAEEELTSLVHEIGLVKTLLAGLDTREKILTLQSDSLRSRLNLYETEFARGRNALAGRMRALFVQGNQRDLELVLTAGSFSALVTRLKYATTLARLDSRLMGRARQQGQMITAAQAQLQSALAGIWEAREEASRESQRLEMMDMERRAVLESLKRERAETEKSLTRLETNEKRLNSLLSGIERKRQGSEDGKYSDPAFALRAGSLAWPVSGEVIRPFGRSVHPKFKTVTVNNGINISAPLGTPVYAVANGEVEFADQLPGFGLCIILDHGAGYYTLYAHLDRAFVTQGGKVSLGEILAEVGEMEGDGRSQLYFEIRRGKTPLDPAEWLETTREFSP
jgi:septal ring factor EnvC (AmiA/AmiB activator)